MAGYVALYRKYRPRFFREIVGQRHVVEILQNSLAKGRIAHAYLFAGVRGTGKTTTARILAKALNCERGVSPEPCGRCQNCLDIDAGKFPDVIEIDAASYRGINEIREIRDNVKLAPLRGRYKVYIIDEVHMLTQEAFNALLKTLEEPPPHVVFILATTDPHKVPSTIISRCQRFDFRRISFSEISEHLRRIADEEGISITDGALELLVRASKGSLRDALSLLDQLRNLEREIREEDLMNFMALLEDEVLWSFISGVLTRDLKATLRALRLAYRANVSYYHLINLVVEELRNMAYWRVLRGEISGELTERQLEYYEKLAEVPLKDIMELMSLMVQQISFYRNDNDPFFLESAVFKWLAQRGLTLISESDERSKRVVEVNVNVEDEKREEKRQDHVELNEKRKEVISEERSSETARPLISDLSELLALVEANIDGRLKRTWKAILRRGSLDFDADTMTLSYRVNAKEGLTYAAKLETILDKVKQKLPELKGLKLKVIETEREGDFKAFVKEVKGLFGLDR